MKLSPTSWAIAIFGGLLFGLLPAASRSAEDGHFRKRVAPLLERRCLSCHNDQQRKGDFSLQTAEAAFAEGYIEAGDPAASHLLEVVTPVDGRAQMPKDADPLSAAEIAALRRWIDDGAMWPAGFKLSEPRVEDFAWWSYQPVERPRVPKIESPWIRTPIDAFILDKMQQRGLSPSKEADRRTLIRRLSYDLTGLPPTPSEVERFVTNPHPRAYEQLVDRLLDSPHYGQRWARHWLDVAKYADTCGYDKDKLRPNAWPYRDYVIRSLNDDKPYARFVQEQIAGDVLFPGEADGVLGLGFIAAGPWDFIGHVEVSESKIDGQVARNLDRDDMVSGALNTFCSLTIQCARCHNHKFDPITQQHYYGLQAIFAAVDRAERPYDLDPEVKEKRRQFAAELQSRQQELVVIEKQIADAGGSRLLELNEQIKQLQSKLTPKKDPQFGYHSAIAKSTAVEKWVEVDLGATVDVARIVLHPCHDDYAGIGAGFGFPVRFRVESSEREAGDDGWRTVADRTRSDVTNPGLVPLSTGELSAKARRVRVRATKLAERKNDYIFALAELEVIDREGENRALGAAVSSLDSIEAPVRWGRRNLIDGRWAEAGDPQSAEQLAEAMREQSALLAKIETPQRVSQRDSLQKAIQQSQQQLAALPKGKMVYAAATHFPPQGNFKPTAGAPRPIHVLLRGDVQQHGEPAAPGVLPLGTQFSASEKSPWRIAADAPEGERRAALARWLTNRDHPLVWRSIVNRVWQYHFGQGIVATPNDFGRMGATPMHPELLDWLAVEFRDGGQSLKQLHRLIVTSSVYRQSSRHEATNAAIDGGNQFLWRMNRRRLEAEEIRDSILSVSGALDPTMGGPGFYLFELEKTQHSPHYEYHKFDPSDPKTHRRSIYRFVVRSQPDPWMTTLDCADSSQSTPRRTETLTSLQALSLLNNRFNLVMAERFAQRIQSEAAGLPHQVDHAMQLIAQRKPSESERNELVAYARDHGLANLCRFLFNLSEFVYLD